MSHGLVAAFGDPKTDKLRFETLKLNWEQMRERQLSYAVQVTEIASSIYYEGWLVAGGAAAGVLSAVIEFPQTIATAGAIVTKSFDLMRSITGSLAGWNDEPAITSGQFLEDWTPASAGTVGGSATEAIPTARARALLKFGGREIADVVNDVVGPIARRVDGTLPSKKLGFTWRRDLLPGADDTLKVDPKNNAHGTVTLLVGTAQATGDAGNLHALTILSKADELVAHPSHQYLYVGLNRSPRTMLRIENDGAPQWLSSAIGNCRERPDIIAVRFDPTTGTYKVDMFEVPSGPQQLPEMRAKLRAIMDMVPLEFRGVYDVVPKLPPPS